MGVNEPKPAASGSAAHASSQQQEALALIDGGEPLADIAHSYNVDATTIGRLKGACAF